MQNATIKKLSSGEAALSFVKIMLALFQQTVFNIFLSDLILNYRLSRL